MSEALKRYVYQKAIKEELAVKQYNCSVSIKVCDPV